MARQSPAKSPPCSLTYRQQISDFFVCDFLNATPKGDMAGMEHPVFSISTKLDRRILRYESTDKKHFMEVTPSVKGHATVYDRDILIFCISQCVTALNRGQKIARILQFKAYDMLISTCRPTGGEAYVRLKEALERLSGTRIKTNITTENEKIIKGFGLIEEYEIIKTTKNNQMENIKITLTDWLFNAILSKEVLTLNHTYFCLRKPLERRLYEIARKHCGQQPTWKIHLKQLQQKCGSTSTSKEFRRLISKIVKENEKRNHIPDYNLKLLDTNIVEFYNSTTLVKTAKKKTILSSSPAIFNAHDNAYFTTTDR